METTMPSLIKPARKVADSLRFGCLLKKIIGSDTNRDTQTAHRGRIEIIVSMSTLESEYGFLL